MGHFDIFIVEILDNAVEVILKRLLSIQIINILTMNFVARPLPDQRISKHWSLEL